MKYCSKCGGEYVDWATGCADCGGTQFLAEGEIRRRAGIPNADRGGFVCVESLDDGVVAGKLADLLEGSGIPVILERPVGGSSAGWSILVRKDLEMRATKLIDEEWEGHELEEKRQSPQQSHEAESDKEEQLRAGYSAVESRARHQPVTAALRRAEALCGRILEELGRGPPILRQVAQQPEQKIGSLLHAFRALAARQREVEARIPPEDTERLEAERAELLREHEAAGDPMIAECLAAALSSIDEQLRHRREILISAKRLEAEQTRLYYALENLYAELLAIRSADEASRQLAAADSRRSVEQLSAEVGAVAEAMGEANRSEDLATASVASSNEPSDS